MDAIAEGLVTVTDDGPRLRAGRCDACSALSFPIRAACAKCSHAGMTEYLLAQRGTLWTWTVQTFRPKPPYDQTGEFTPFGVGYVELDGELRVESRLTFPHELEPRIGLPMKLTLVTLAQSDGEATHFAFEPA